MTNGRSFRSDRRTSPPIAGLASRRDSLTLFRFRGCTQEGPHSVSQHPLREADPSGLPLHYLVETPRPRASFANRLDRSPLVHGASGRFAMPSAIDLANSRKLATWRVKAARSITIGSPSAGSFCDGVETAAKRLSAF